MIRGWNLTDRYEMALKVSECLYKIDLDQRVWNVYHNPIFNAKLSSEYISVSENVLYLSGVDSFST